MLGYLQVIMFGKVLHVSEPSHEVSSLVLILFCGSEAADSLCFDVFLRLFCEHDQHQ